MRPKFIFCFIWFFFSFTAHSQEPNQQGDIEKVFDTYFREVLKSDPDLASSLGNLESLGYSYSTDRFTDYSGKAVNERFDICKKYLNILHSFSREKLTYSQRKALDILTWNLAITLEGEKYKDYNYIPNQLDGLHNSLTTIMTEYHGIEKAEDAENYLSRLKNYEERINQEIQNLKIRKDKKIIPPLFIIEAAEAEMSDFIKPEIKNNILYTTFVEKLGNLKNINGTAKEEYCSKAEKNINEFLYPSYRKFIEELHQLKTIADNTAGVNKLPDGENYYKYSLKSYTTLDISPDEIYNIGKKEVSRIQDEEKKILISLGFPEKKTFSEMIKSYYEKARNDWKAELVYASDRREEILEAYQNIINDVNTKIPKYFSLIPKDEVIVQPVPSYKEKTMPSNYSNGSIDGKRKSIFYANIANGAFKPGMKTLTYHEAIPGHHFQIALQRESPVYRMFMNLVFYSGFIEGWALYAEKLAMECGWFSDEYTRLGYLNSELFRAIRLVVDVGIHYKGWSKEKALNYFKENLGGAPVMEVNRYCVTPGQACGYKLGEIKILQLREKAKKELGQKFDIKDFHKALLENGSMPLELLEKQIEEYINGKNK